MTEVSPLSKAPNPQLLPGRCSDSNMAVKCSRDRLDDGEIRRLCGALAVIERIQNINLRRLYEGRKIELENKNDPSVGAREKILYHGTSKDSCSSIMKTNFNRNFSGQNATVYGHGTYFAVNASYSAQTMYAVPAADGTQLMFVARVLTGHYAQGQADMRTPPVRVAPDLYDSVVDDEVNPSMFVVFHDCQAYPEYLITFK
ncbi:Protein mono-ADP-ribosyltransferase PARP14 [Labeo rohita]|uniref:Poly [ADP-ribose] polymerase n=1 Tax=Labeo rohita TaxID=84645 RepID=A0ABQ8MJE2_LABRO|nr:Protein mono-ADP-ribosyltransferase PARP14 [Labeo rohita]